MPSSDPRPQEIVVDVTELEELEGAIEALAYEVRDMVPMGEFPKRISMTLEVEDIDPEEVHQDVDDGPAGGGMGGGGGGGGAPGVEDAPGGGAGGGPVGGGNPLQDEDDDE